MQSTGAVGSLEERTAQLVIELFVSDLAASLAFYEALGFEVERRTPSFAALRWEDRYLLLSERPGAAAGPSPPHLRIIVSDAEAVCEAARAEGLRFVDPLRDRGYGLLDFTIQDPDGWLLRFAQVVDA